VLHLSAGKTGGPHRGDTLLERAVDQMLETPGIVLVQSVGNYADTAMHTHARVGPDQHHVINWVTPERDRTPNELEIWYSGHDVFEVTLTAPDGQTFSVALDNRLQLRDGDSVWGNFYHRRHEPNSGLNHVVIFLYTAAPSGTWRVTIRAARWWTGDCTRGSSVTPAAGISRGSREVKHRHGTRQTPSAIASGRLPWALTMARARIGRRRASAAAARRPTDGRSRRLRRRATRSWRRDRCHATDGMASASCA
jgi:hypothetical protein